MNSVRTWMIFRPTVIVKVLNHRILNVNLLFLGDAKLKFKEEEIVALNF